MDPPYLFDRAAFAAELREALTADDLSLRQAAPLLRLSFQVLSNLTKNLNAPSIEAYFRIRAWLDLRQKLMAEWEA
jgi:transcriptional regulator with XRE-family HTH domain